MDAFYQAGARDVCLTGQQPLEEAVKVSEKPCTVFVGITWNGKEKERFCINKNCPHRIFKGTCGGFLWQKNCNDMCHGIAASYIITLAWTGRIEEKKQVPALPAEKSDSGPKNGESYMDVEEYLPGVVAKQMPAEYGKEARGLQAIIARTFIYQKMNEKRGEGVGASYGIFGGEADGGHVGSELCNVFQAVEEAVRSTAGEVITYDGRLIEPLFHRASTGMTRSGDESHPYLQAVASKRDVEAEGYLTMMVWSKEEFAGRINQIAGSVPVDAGQLPSPFR